MNTANNEASIGDHNDTVSSEHCCEIEQKGIGEHELRKAREVEALQP